MNHGQLPDLSTPAELTDFYVVESNEPEEIQDYPLGDEDWIYDLTGEQIV